METVILCNKPLETALKGAGFKIGGIERRGKKTVITVERVILKGSISADNACCENVYIGTTKREHKG